MSSVAIPLPKPAGLRPPFGPPPNRTTFDSRPGDHEEPIHRRIADSVDQVLKACKNADEDSAPLLIRLIEQRKRIVEQELAMLRMFEPKPMPPLLANLYTLDFLSDDSDVEHIYVRLLEELDRAAEKINFILGERKG
jgi:hypothetical protein